MKKLLLALIVAGATVSTYAQGTLNFASIGGGAAGTVNAPATNRTTLVNVAPNTTGTRASGATFLVQLYVGAAGIVDPALLTTNGVSGTPAAFLTGAQAGYFTGGTRTITGFAGGTTITAQVRAWNASFASWEAAPAAERTSLSGAGAPNLIQIALVAPPTTPLNMVGLQAFDIGSGVPEPSSIALGLLGLGAVALFRRRK